MTDMERAAQAVFRFAEKVEAAFGEKAWSFRAFIEPQSADTPEGAEIFPAGISDGRRYALIAERTAFSGGEKGAVISAGSGVFEVLRLEKMPSGHWEGVMRRKAGDG